MDARTLEVSRSMQRIADVIDSHPDLHARAAESTAFEHFQTVIAMFEALHAEHSSTPNELRELDARRRMLMDEIRLSLASVEATRVLLLGDAVAVPPLAQPPRRLDAYRFSYQAIAAIDLAAKHAPAFIREGLHPRTFDDARALIDALIDVDRQHAYLEVNFRSFDRRVDQVVELATKRKRQLYLEFKRSLTAELRATWRQAGSLGRKHRPKTLGAGESQKLLPSTPGG
ncbi:MAG: hypothetical protein JWM41_385 [Gemmatimonadetes bacterium]|nr:hypothetical protein [Gemmatimonadota bacterium]